MVQGLQSINSSQDGSGLYLSHLSFCTLLISRLGRAIFAKGLGDLWVPQKGFLLFIVPSAPTPCSPSGPRGPRQSKEEPSMYLSSKPRGSCSTYRELRSQWLMCLWTLGERQKNYLPGKLEKLYFGKLLIDCKRKKLLHSITHLCTSSSHELKS